MQTTLKIKSRSVLRFGEKTDKEMEKEKDKMKTLRNFKTFERHWGERSGKDNVITKNCD